MMAIDLFWRNLRTAAGLFGPLAETADADAARLERALRGPALWLTPRSVNGFDVRDFDFLEPAQQEALGASVEKFRAVANQVSPKKPASASQKKEAGQAFLEILKILKPDQFIEADAFRIQTLLERELQGKLPSWVKGITCETGTDTGDDPAVWIWLHVTDEATDRGLVAKHAIGILEEAQSAFDRIGSHRWPYILFRNPSELPASGERTA